MSLARIAIRTAAVEALKGRTQVGDAVLDSPNGALSVHADGSIEIGEGQDRPFISVYTDSSVVNAPSLRGLTDNGAIKVIFEFGVSSVMTKRTDEGVVIVGATVPPSDEGMELYLDLVQREIVDALTDEANAWAEIYRDLHHRVAKIETASRRNEEGATIAGRQIQLTLDVIEDPVRGEPYDDTAIGRFLAAARAGHPAVVAAIETMLSGTAQDWLTAQRRMGMTASELYALGRGPIPQDTRRATPELTEGAADVGPAEPS